MSFVSFFPQEAQIRGVPQSLLDQAAVEGHLTDDGWRVKADGSQSWAHMELTALYDEDGHLNGYVHRQQDLSDRPRIPEHLVVPREALFHTQKADTIAQIAGGVAHDFNNLFMVVAGSLELMPRWLSDDPKAHQVLQGAMRATRKGATLIRQLLAFARRQELKPEPVQVDGLVGSMYELLDRTMGPLIHIERDLDHDFPCVMADRNQLEMVVLNLALNARDAMPHGGQLTLRGHLGRPNPNEGVMLCLSLQDNGRGMDAITLACATDPFFTTKEVGQGSGLGLSMAQGLVEQSGGHLRLHSTPGQGTTVEVWLPLADALDAGGRVEHPTANPVHEVPSHKASLRILVVDDDDLVRDTMVARLEDAGHQVHAAPSALDALAWLHHGDAGVDLVLTDQMMPGMTGTMLAAHVRKTWPDLPIVLASGYMGEDTPTTFNMVRLDKPFTSQQLNQAIDQALGTEAHATAH